MKKLASIARVTEIDALSDTLLRLYADETAVANDAFLKKYFAELQKLSDAITEAIKRDHAQSNMDEKDAARDEAVRNLGDLLDGYAVFPVPEKKAAALALKAIFDKYGRKITGESYANESSFIESLLKDLDTSDAKANIAKLDGIEATVKAVRTTQDEFTAAYDAWAKAQNADAAAVNATGVKKPLVALINDKIVPYLTAMAEEDEFKHFASLVAQEIDKVNGAVSGRSGKAEKGE